MRQKVPLLITSAIRASAPFTKLADPTARLRATLESVALWTRTPAVDSIVVVDGSGYDFSPDLQRLQQSSGKKIEFLFFQNDESRLKKQGKGFGEGEIVLRALTDSSILSGCTHFAKCTGKLFVRNYARCLSAFRGEFQCAVRGKRTIEAIDTRLYFASRDFWLRHLADAHLRVNDPAGYFLEDSYLDRLREIGLRGFTLPIPPIIVGRSGSSNTEYAPLSRYHYLVRRLRYSIFRRIF